MNKTVKATLAIVAASAAAVASVVTAPSLVSAWGNSGTLRPSYTKEQINNGVLGNNIVFNSISDSVIGDEKNFVGAREDTGVNAGAQNVWNANDIKVENGKTYLIRLYVHNNSPKGKDAVSTNTRVAFSIPNTSAKQIQVNGYIFSDNSLYNQYWDYVNFNADVPFHLEYVKGSASLENNGIGKNGGVALSDNIVYKAASEHGVQIGYSSLNGEVPGCYGYASYVGIKVRVVYDTAYTMSTKVRLVGSKDWATTVDAKVGDKVEFEIQYRNTSSADQRNVMVRSVLPTSLRYLAGTTKLWNSDYNGVVNNDNTIATSGINIGHYGSQANAYIRFQAEVVEDGLVCGGNTLKTWAQVGVGDITLQDATAVNVQNGVCKQNEEPETPPVKLPSTGPEAVAGGIVAAGSIVTAAGYYIASRRSLR